MTTQLRPLLNEACAQTGKWLRYVTSIGTLLLILSAVCYCQTIAYIGPNAQTPGTTGVSLIDPTGANPQSVPVNLVGLENPKWSRNAQFIVAEGTLPGGTKPDIFLFNRSGGSLQQVTDIVPDQILVGASVEELFPAISPTGNRVVVSELIQAPDPVDPLLVDQDLVIQLFSSTGVPGPFVLGVGYSPTLGTYDFTGWGLDWSPKSDVLAIPYGTLYLCPNSLVPVIDVTEIWAAPVPQTSNLSSNLPAGSFRITNAHDLACAIYPTTVHNVEPVFSPDGTKVAFAQWIVGGTTTNSYVHIINVDGTGDRELVSVPGSEVLGISWSGDGTQLVFDQLPTPNGIPQPQSARVYRVNLDATGLVQIAGPAAGEPTWSWVFPVPSISSLSTTSAIAGTTGFTLTINGSNFVSTSVIRWNGANRATKFVSQSQLQATILASDISVAGTAHITVFNPKPGGGTSNAASFMIQNPVPVLSSLSPSSAAAGGSGFTLTVNGSKFVAGSVVRWNGSARSTTFVTSSQLKAAILSTDIALAATAPITVVNPTPGGGISNTLNFTVLNLPLVALSPTSLTFANQLVGTASPSKPIQLSNVGKAALTILGISTSGDFFVPSKNCGSSLAPGASCTISVAFRPTAIGSRTGSLSISDNASGSPQLVHLTGTGTVVTLSPTSLSFSSQTVGTKSLPKPVTMTNHAATTLTISSIAIAGTNAADFVITSKTCASSLGAGASCLINVAFKPTATGTRKATLNTYDNGGGSPQQITLVGSGT